jgi:8-oxo-dGTP diphosphatase/A/G-specific adenine glycosylase
MEDSRKQGVAAIIQKFDKFLFVKRSDYKETAKGYWCPVTGKIEINETQEEAIRREVMEEVGLNVIAEKKICQIPTHDNQYTLHFWTTIIISGEARLTSNEATEIKWVTLEEMKNLKPVFEEDIQIHQNLSNSH